MFAWDFEWHIDQQMREKSPHPMLVWKAWSHPCVSSVHYLISMASITHSNSMQTFLLKWKKNAFLYLELIPRGIFKKKMIAGSKHVYQMFASVQLFSCVWLFETPWTAARSLPCPSPTPGAYSNSCPSSWWWHPTISSSVIPFSCLQSFPASGSLLRSQLIASGGQSIVGSASASVLPMHIQDWFPLGWTGWISLQSKGLSRVFSNTAVQKHQFFGTQLSSIQSNSHIHTWLLEKP